MIFVTVGTHEQPFNRLVKYMDDIKKKGVIEEEVIIQTGYSTYEPQYCTWNRLYPYQQMVEYVKDARVVITHGGPSSFIMPLQVGKIPIVVPRQKRFDEHVNNHQVDFTKAVEDRMGIIIVVDDLIKLSNVIINYNEIISRLENGLKSNNTKFNEDLTKIIDEMFGETSNE